MGGEGYQMVLVSDNTQLSSGQPGQYVTLINKKGYINECYIYIYGQFNLLIYFV